MNLNIIVVGHVGLLSNLTVDPKAVMAYVFACFSLSENTYGGWMMMISTYFWIVEGGDFIY